MKRTGASFVCQEALITKERRREVPVKLLGDTYILVFTTAGMVAAEDTLDVEQSEIQYRLETGRVGARLIRALLFGATRKYHRQTFRSPDEVGAFLDRLEEESEDYDGDTEKLSVALMAAFTNSSPDEIEKRMMGEKPPVGSAEGSAETSAGGSAGPKKVAKPGKSSGGNS